jgi:uncharacterized membrane protein
MDSTGKRDALIVAGLVALSLVPIVSGMLRIGTLAAGGPVTPESARFFAAPAAIVIHIVAGTYFSLLGALQFAPGFRRQHTKWHRRVGRSLVVIGSIAAASGFWMALTFTFVPADTPLTHAFRLAFGPAMIVALGLAFVAIRSRNVPRHQAWMRRSYAIGLVVGTQTTLLLPFQLLGLADPSVRTLAMGAAWILNIGFTEWLIRRKRPAKTIARPSALA